MRCVIDLQGKTHQQRPALADVPPLCLDAELAKNLQRHDFRALH